MRNNMNILFYIFTFFIAATAWSEEDPIVVRLSTETQRIPLYLTHINDTNSGFDSSYAAKLEKVLQFDLDHNGMTYILKSSQEKEKQAAGFDQMPKAADWKAIGAFYIVKVQIPLSPSLSIECWQR